MKKQRWPKSINRFKKRFYAFDLIELKILQTGAVQVTTMASRATWNAVTNGTPNLRILAVRHISARPPGAVARINMAPDSSISHANRSPNKQESKRVKRPLTITPSKSDLDSERKLGLKRTPSEQPISICARVVNSDGIADKLNGTGLGHRLWHQWIGFGQNKTIEGRMSI